MQVPVYFAALCPQFIKNVDPEVGSAMSRFDAYVISNDGNEERAQVAGWVGI